MIKYVSGILHIKPYVDEKWFHILYWQSEHYQPSIYIVHRGFSSPLGLTFSWCMEKYICTFWFSQILKRNVHFVDVSNTTEVIWKKSDIVVIF